MYDRITVQIIGSLPADAVCIDIGASNGAVLKQMVRLVPQGSFFAFEARPDAAKALKDRFPNVETHAVALSDEVGTATFNIAVEDPGYSGLRRQEYPDEFTVREIEVPVNRLDNIIPSGLDVSFIKIDVEGAEYAVLQGASEICKRCKPLMVFEYGLAGRNNYSITPEMIYNLLCSMGMSIWLMPHWIKGKGPLSLQQFEKVCDKHWYFVAHPHVHTVF